MTLQSAVCWTWWTRSACIHCFFAWQSFRTVLAALEMMMTYSVLLLKLRDQQIQYLAGASLNNAVGDLCPQLSMCRQDLVQQHNAVLPLVAAVALMIL